MIFGFIYSQFSTFAEVMFLEDFAKVKNANVDTLILWEMGG